MAQLWGQFPRYFAYDNESGLPSNEVYSLLQDDKGFIWIGCEAGLYKFDGIRYWAYKHKSQNSKPISGLSLSPSGRLYCYNFKGQIFYVDLQADSLVLLSSQFQRINALACDQAGQLFVAHAKGLSQYQEREATWVHHHQTALAEIPLVSSAQIGAEGQVSFITSKGIGRLYKGQIALIPSNLFQPVGAFILRAKGAQEFILSTYQNGLYSLENGQILAYPHQGLQALLKSRKVTNAVFLSDDCLWICTFKGLIRLNLETQETALFYPELSFSDCLIDREGQYWLATLQNGLMRVPNLNYLVWDKEHELIQQDKLTKIASDGRHIYFASNAGHIGQLDAVSQALRVFASENGADVQSLNYDPQDSCLYFNANQLFYLKNGRIGLKKSKIQSIKAVLKANGDYLFLHSFGTYVEGRESYQILSGWSRDFIHEASSNQLWIAGNEGLFKCAYQAKKWEVVQTFLPGTQVLSIDIDQASQVVYALAFNGLIYAISPEGAIKPIAEMPQEVQANKLKFAAKRLFVASNKGVWILGSKWLSGSEPSPQESWYRLSALSGLVSENVQDLLILQDDLWLATGKGLQKIPLSQMRPSTLARVYLKDEPAKPQLNYGQSLILYPETSLYSANGNFEYAYRLNEQEWVKLPSSIEQLELQNLPVGSFKFELKVIDHLGQDSENKLVLEGFVAPPYYQTWWFMTLLLLLFAGVLALIIKRIIANIQRREQEKTQLAHHQLTALKAQMNPHFMYNTLNSIQSLILKQDIKNSNLYLSKFSQLMRQVLDCSEKEEISLREELDILELYLSLEKLRFGADFSYQIQLAEDLDLYGIFLPPLLIQPFVENAIKHGLLHKKGEKRLDIDLELEGEALLFKIRDNGIGRQRAKAIQERQGIKHKSFSTQSTEKRLALLNRANRDKNIELEIRDLQEGESPRGTEVVLKIT